MKTASLLLVVVTCTVIAGCKKKGNDNDIKNIGTYYFKYNLSGYNYLYNSQVIQPNNNGYNMLGGYVADTALKNYGGVSFSFGNDSASSSSIISLAGKTFNFNPNVYPQMYIDIITPVSHDENTTTNDTTYSATVDSVTYLGYNSTLGFDLYAIKGVFKVKLSDINSSNTIGDATNGSFNIQCTVNHF